MHAHDALYPPMSLSGSQRRQFLQTTAAILASLACRTPAISGHVYIGALKPPLPAPQVELLLLDGTVRPLRSLLQGQFTVLQLMFTGCSATCPIQGAMFSQVQEKLQDIGNTRIPVQLLSVSIDPLGDDIQAMRNWLGHHGAKPQRWRGALTTVRSADTLLDFLAGRANSNNSNEDRHAGRAYLFDDKAQFVYRTEEMPSVQSVLSPIRQWIKAKRG